MRWPDARAIVRAMGMLDTLASWNPFNVLVVGDFMLDQLVAGDAERLTSDAPVPVLHVRTTEAMAGGAANVCLDLAALHGRVRALANWAPDWNIRFSSTLTLSSTTSTCNWRKIVGKTALELALA